MPWIQLLPHDYGLMNGLHVKKCRTWMTLIVVWLILIHSLAEIIESYFYHLGCNNHVTQNPLRYKMKQPPSWLIWQDNLNNESFVLSTNMVASDITCSPRIEVLCHHVPAPIMQLGLPVVLWQNNKIPFLSGIEYFFMQDDCCHVMVQNLYTECKET